MVDDDVLVHAWLFQKTILLPRDIMRLSQVFVCLVRFLDLSTRELLLVLPLG
jgi:hypothetical protein